MAIKDKSLADFLQRALSEEFRVELGEGGGSQEPVDGDKGDEAVGEGVSGAGVCLCGAGQFGFE